MKFIARQPIFNPQRDVFAYELLFRSGIQNSCEGIDLEQASALMLDSSFLIGLQKVTEGRRAFINCPRDFLLRKYISLFPREQVVVEILETIEPDQNVVEACRSLKQEGYLLALDDFVETPAWAPLVALVDFIKVDFRLTPRVDQHTLASRYGACGIRMVAEKVETQEEFSRAKEMGYSLFQGYFFCRPEMMQHQAIPSFKLAYLELLQAATAPELDMQALAGKIKHEASLTYKLLRCLNSAASGLRCEIHSIPHALMLLGERELRKWIAVVCIGVMADGKPDELMTIPLVRGRFCELLAPLAGMAGDSNDLFLSGLLSMVDVMLNQPLESILAELPVRLQIKEALLARTGLYRDMLEMAVAHERADWERVAALAQRLGIRESRIPEIYVSAVDWASALRRGVRVPVAV
jgi:EAL and modified HD-GYP domain-containing signal transduction protein